MHTNAHHKSVQYEVRRTGQTVPGRKKKKAKLSGWLASYEAGKVFYRYNQKFLTFEPKLSTGTDAPPSYSTGTVPVRRTSYLHSRSTCIIYSVLCIQMII